MCEHQGCSKAFSNASDRAKHQNRTHSNEVSAPPKKPSSFEKLLLGDVPQEIFSSAPTPQR